MNRSERAWTASAARSGGQPDDMQSEIDELSATIIARIRTDAGAIRTMILSLWSMIIFAGMVSQGITRLGVDSNVSLFVATFAGIIGYLLCCRRYTANYKNTVSSTAAMITDLAQYGSPQCLPAVLEALHSRLTHSKVQAAAAEALQKLLPTVAAGDDAILTSRHRAILREELLDPKQRKIKRDSFSRPTEDQRARYLAERKAMALALLRAYEYLGNADDLPALALIATRAHPLSQDEELRAAAILSLERIKTRLKANAAMSNLLLAAEAPSLDAAVLPRPAEPCAAQPAELVRAIGDEAAPAETITRTPGL